MVKTDMASNFRAKTPLFTQDAISIAQLVASNGASRSPALVIANDVLSYADLIARVQQLAALLKQRNIQRVGILAAKSLEVYLGVLAAHWLGIAYVPLNPGFPPQRLLKITEQSAIDGLLVAPEYLPLAATLSSAGLLSLHLTEVPQAGLTLAPVQVEPADLAYLMFTSGSTGEPKGVPITFGNLAGFFKAALTRYELMPSDRVSQFSALSFDVSIFDMCLAWSAGASLYVVPDYTKMLPAKFITDNALTVWLSVPTVITNMKKLHILRNASLPSLRYSLFTGEALSLEQAQSWQLAASASRVENLYGPTEVTIDCMGHTYEENSSSYRDQVPMGKPFAGVDAGIIDNENNFLPVDTKGELVLTGGQVTNGYWRDSDMTARKFKNILHPVLGLQRWFLTGDYCYLDVKGIYHYLSRLDNQCKILGNRVELEEIEFHVRDLTHCFEVFAGEVNQEIVVVVNEQLDLTSLMNQLKERLPLYMLPAHILHHALLYNANGKLDRPALSVWLHDFLAGGGRPC
jgi:D-alanine--poly(phosphoribitol) ligase subunit 1